MPRFFRAPRTLVVAALALSLSPLRAKAQDATLAAVKDHWKAMAGNIAAAADEVSEADYAFKPTASVRSFGELIGHVAGTHNLICAAVLGDTVPAEDAIEKTAKTKAALVAAFKASVTYCDKAYAIAPARFADRIDMFGSKSTKIGALMLNAVHDGEHYGNVVTYMRLKGLVPPSSKR